MDFDKCAGLVVCGRAQKSEPSPSLLPLPTGLFFLLLPFDIRPFSECCPGLWPQVSIVSDIYSPHGNNNDTNIGGSLPRVNFCIQSCTPRPHSAFALRCMRSLPAFRKREAQEADMCAQVMADLGFKPSFISSEPRSCLARQPVSTQSCAACNRLPWPLPGLQVLLKPTWAAFLLSSLNASHR